MPGLRRGWCSQRSEGEGESPRRQRDDRHAATADVSLAVRPRVIDQKLPRRGQSLDQDYRSVDP